MAALVAGKIGDSVLYGSQALVAHRIEIAIVTVFLILVVLGPLLAFMPAMLRARRDGLTALRRARGYVRAFVRAQVAARSTR